MLFFALKQGENCVYWSFCCYFTGPLQIPWLWTWNWNYPASDRPVLQQEVHLGTCLINLPVLLKHQTMSSLQPSRPSKTGSTTSFIVGATQQQPHKGAFESSNSARECAGSANTPSNYSLCTLQMFGEDNGVSSGSVGALSCATGSKRKH